MLDINYRLYLFLFAFGIFVSCHGILDTNPATRLNNFAGFSYFKFEQIPALGFCPNIESLYKAEIFRMDGDEYRFAASDFKLISYDPQTEGCAGYPVSDTLCMTEKILRERYLTPLEVEQLKQVFRTIETIPAIPEECFNMSVDPCLIIECAWDAEILTDYYCSYNRLSGAQREELFDLFTELKNKGLPDSN